MDATERDQCRLLMRRARLEVLDARPNLATDAEYAALVAEVDALEEKLGDKAYDDPDVPTQRLPYREAEF